MTAESLPDIAAILEEIKAEVQSAFGKGHVAKYIPALARVPSTKIGMSACAIEAIR